MGMLLIVPFVTKIQGIIKPWNRGLAAFFDRLDELTIMIFLPLALISIYRDCKKEKNIDLPYLLILFPIFIICLAGFISGMINGNVLTVTALGTLEYVKFFLVIFIYAAFFREFDMFQRIFQLLLIVAVFIGLVAFLQEAWVICSRYFFERNIADNRVYIFISNLLNIDPKIMWGEGFRLGIYRADSVLSHYNLLGLYSLLILSIYFHVRKKVNIVVIFALFAGIFSSVSRTAYAGFALLTGLQICKGRKWLLIFLIPVIVLLFYMGLFDNVDMTSVKNEELNGVKQEMLSYRQFARDKAMAVWKDHPIWGVGAGMFGGSVAFKYKSPLYEEYNFTLILNWFHSLDQLWPQVLAEMGIVGTAALASLFISILFVLFVSRQRATSDEMKNFFAGLATFTIIFLFYTLSGNMNNVSILYPYCAFAGMGFGCLGQPYLIKEAKE